MTTQSVVSVVVFTKKHACTPSACNTLTRTLLFLPFLVPINSPQQNQALQPGNRCPVPLYHFLPSFPSHSAVFQMLTLS